MKLYTRAGDDGTTGLFGGERVGKDHPRVEAYGTVDELNASLGLAGAACGAGFEDGLRGHLERLQSRLFDLGADLATPAGSRQERRVHRLDQGDVSALERLIDEIDGGNEPLRAFVLPGGTDLAARLHLARTICRRAERRLVNLARSETVGAATIMFLNRLGDLLFAMARRVNREAGVADVPWVSLES